MTALDDKLLPKTKAKIEKVAIDATWITHAGLVSDPVTSTVTEATPDEYAVRIAPTSDAAKYDAPTLGEQGEAVTFLAGLGLVFEPGLGHRLLLHGATWRVVGLKALRPGDQVAAWRVHLAGGE